MKSAAYPNYIMAIVCALVIRRITDASQKCYSAGAGSECELKM